MYEADGRVYTPRDTPVPGETMDLQSKIDEDGYVLVRNVLDEQLIAEAREHVGWLLERNPGRKAEQLSHELITQDAFWVRLVSDDRLLDLAEQFVGANLGLFASHYIAKPPRLGKAVPWHQDGSYWPLEPMEVVTIWLALDKTDKENGCMRVIPGSHKDTLINKSSYVKQQDEMAFEIAMDPKLVNESKSVDIELEPGDVEIHHPNIVHGSWPNRSDRWRRGLTIRYIPTTTRITAEKPHPAAFIFRGEGFANGNAWNPLPEFDESTSMPFASSGEWNERCRAQNSRSARLLVGT